MMTYNYNRNALEKQKRYVKNYGNQNIIFFSNFDYKLIDNFWIKVYTTVKIIIYFFKTKKHKSFTFTERKKI